MNILSTGSSNICTYCRWGFVDFLRYICYVFSVIKFFLRLREFNCFAVECVLILIHLPLVFLQAMPVVVSESRISDLAIRWKATFIVTQLHSPTRKKIYSLRRTIQKSDQDCPCNALQKLYKLSILSLLITVHSSIY